MVKFQSDLDFEEELKQYGDGDNVRSNLTRAKLLSVLVKMLLVIPGGRD